MKKKGPALIPSRPWAATPVGGVRDALTVRACFVVAALLAATPAAWSGTAAGKVGAAHTQVVQFAPGASSAQLRGSIKGDVDATFTVDARAGQTLALSLTSANRSLNINVLSPGANEAMFIGSSKGTQASLVLPVDGNYVVQVYLMRNAARRNESAAYTLDVAVTGQALAALPAAQDARVTGTPFHATASVPCQTPGAAAGDSCKAGVIRRGRDATATVELRSASGLVRNLLFIKGQPVASDSAQEMRSSRQGDTVTVRIGSDERYDVPDVLLTGG
jgi:hypothetical protein